MSWQEALRGLDQELAEGRISADQYRVRRDEVLTSAVTPDLPVVPSSAGSTQMMRPVAPQPPAQPANLDGAQPPPSQTDHTQIVEPSPDLESRSPAASSAEPTQIVAADIVGEAERTQAVSGWRAERPSESDADRTQVVPGGPPAPPWGQRQEDEKPPWSSATFPPPVPTNAPDWIRQGPETFRDGKRDHGKGKIIAAVLTVLLVGGLAFGAYWVWGGTAGTPSGEPGDSQPVPPPTSPKPTKTTTSKPPDPLPVADLPGSLEKHTDIKAFTDIPKLNYLNQAELDVYNVAGPTDAKFNVRHLPNGNTAVFLMAKAADMAVARTAAVALKDIQISNGATLAANPPAGVLVTEIEAKEGQPAQVRCHYAYGGVIVRVEIWNAAGLAAVRADSVPVLQAQLKLMPADV